MSNAINQNGTGLEQQVSIQWTDDCSAVLCNRGT